ncbi:protein piccolo-like isoform X2 [Thrips palmi]|uniref:Protein piccolo-like isoform X2 n=1 Tax=Thrips palmi TaxID=161013 RepID=A0A6P8YQE7_THRPL|nr:protein piccolo-like isoform X2 [Thrips palmi]
MAKTVVQTALAALLACSVLVPARCAVVSLVDVTGTTPRTLADEPGVSFVGYQEPQAPARRPGVVSLSDVTGLTPEQHAALGGNAYTGLQQPGYTGYTGTVNLVDVNGVPRPHQGGVVSLTDVTGVAPQYLAQPAPPPHPQPLHPEQGYDPQRPYSPCYVPGAHAYTQPQHPVSAVHQGGVRLPRSKRSPQHGVVRLSDVAGPGAGRYPSYGPPAYVRPYPYYNYGYSSWYRPRPYYSVLPVPCFGLLCL